jgi:hypothetical protein
MIGAKQPVYKLDDRQPRKPQKPLENKVEYLCGFPFDPFDNPRRLSCSGKLYKTRFSLSNVNLSIYRPAYWRWRQLDTGLPKSTG